MILFRGGTVFGADFFPEETDVLTDGDRIAAVGAKARQIFRSSSDPEKISFDITGKYLLPGFIDLHIHGCNGADTCDASVERLSEMSMYLARFGVTSFLPTTMALSRENLRSTVSAAAEFTRRAGRGSAPLGIRIEGPYLSKARAGAQETDFFRDPSVEEISGLEREFGRVIRMIDIAPEICGGTEFIRTFSDRCVLSAAHTDASYNDMQTAFASGLTHITHLFNAMPTLGHRSPGPVGAAFDSKCVTAELICDGYHVHPAVLRLAFTMLGDSRSVIISDAMRAAGCPDGEYILGGQTVHVKGQVTTGASGGPAGSVTLLPEAMRRLLSFGIPLRQIIRSATINPARVIGEDREIGSIETGKRADLVVADGKLQTLMTVIRGTVFGDIPAFASMDHKPEHPENSSSESGGDRC